MKSCPKDAINFIAKNKKITKSLSYKRLRILALHKSRSMAWLAANPQVGELISNGAKNLSLENRKPRYGEAAGRGRKRKEFTVTTRRRLALDLTGEFTGHDKGAELTSCLAVGINRDATRQGAGERARVGGSGRSRVNLIE